MPYNSFDVAVQSDLGFINWIRIDFEKNTIAQKLKTENTLRRIIKSINCEFYSAEKRELYCQSIVFYLKQLKVKYNILKKSIWFKNVCLASKLFQSWLF